MTTTTERDELGERLIEAGLAPNGFILDLNHSLTTPYDMELPAPWNLPSRLFRFPIEVSEARSGLPRRIGLMHPELGDHPFVRRVAALGFELDPAGAPNAYGVSKTRTAVWWHAVDLIDAGMWRELLDTAHFTTPGSIFHAVAFGLRYDGRLTTTDARAIMDELGATEPDDRGALIRGMMAPSPVNPDGKGKHWPINGRADSPEDEAWTFIYGIEEGWFEYDRSKHLQWSQLGRDRHAAGDSATFVEASGQAAFAF